MILSRFRTVLSVVLHNLASYSHQAIQRFVQASTGFVLQALSDVSELSYSFFCSHCEAYKRKVAVYLICVNNPGSGLFETQANPAYARKKTRYTIF